MKSFDDLKKRIFFRVGVAYLVFAWLIVQVIGTLTPIYDLPWILVRGFAFMLIMGYPLVVLMAFVYEKTHSTRGWEKYNEEGYINKAPGKVFYRVIVSVIALTLTIMLTDIFVLRQQTVQVGNSGNAGMDSEEGTEVVAEANSAE